MLENIEHKKQYLKVLDERQQRLFYGMLALSLGRSGVRGVSAAFEVHPDTVRAGKKEFISSEFESLPPKRIRKAGGGRKKKFTKSLN